MEILGRKSDAKDVGKGPSFQQAMVRIKDPKKTIPFYRDTLGLKVVCERHFPQWKFSLYFLADVAEGDAPSDPKSEEASNWMHRYSGTLLELTQ